MSLFSDFAVESVASLVGAFAGVFLALVAERRGRARHEAAHREELERDFERAKHATLGSVVKNTAEAGRLKRSLPGGGPPTLLEAALETGVWDATRDQFVRLAPSVDERVLFASFFDQVARLAGLVDFYRGLQSSVVTARVPHEDPEILRLLEEAAGRVEDAAETVRVSGLMLVTDYGQPVHRRMLGLAELAPHSRGSEA